MSDFDSLTWAFDKWFDTPLCDLPDALRQRVEKEFFPMPWEGITADQRRSVALQNDYRNDPTTESERKFWQDFFIRGEELKAQVVQWEATATPTANRQRIGTEGSTANRTSPRTISHGTTATAGVW